MAMGGAGGNSHRLAGRYRPMSEINVTPLVDVMLVLLVVFMVAAPLLTVGVPVDLPQTQAPPITEPKEPLVITINGEGRIFIQDTEVPTESLIPRLEAITANNSDAPLYVRGDKAINYGRVVEVMSLVSAAGFSKVSLVAEAPKGAAGKAASAASGLRWVIVRPADGRPPGAARIRRRDRHGRGMRGPLAPVGSPLYRTRAERFDDLVLQAVAQLEPRWQAELSGVEFAVEEVPPADPATDLLVIDGLGADDLDPVPLARLDPAVPTPADPAEVAGPADPGVPLRSARPARIVLYRRPLLARAEGEEELSELVLDVVIEEVARLLGVDPQEIDPDFPEED